MRQILFLLITTLVVASTASVCAFSVEYAAPNVTLHLEFAEANYPKPPDTLAGRPVLEWLDAAAPDNPANVWGWSGNVLGYEPGWYNMLYPYTDGSYIYANTSIPTEAVAFAAGCDDNDGRGQFYVDGTLVAQIDYYSAVPVYVVLVVNDLPSSTHHLQLTSLGGATALFGGAAIGAVPEPSSLLALFFGMGGIGGMVWRRKR